MLSEFRKLITDVLRILRSTDRQKELVKTPLYANALYLMLANIANALFGFVFWILAARLYTTEAVGTASAILSTAGLLAMISNLGFGYGVIRFLKSSDRPAKLINSSFTLTGLLSIVAAVIFIMGLGIWSPGLVILRQSPGYLVVFLLFVPLLVLTGLVDQSLMAERRAGFIFIRSLIFNILRLILSVFLAAFLHTLGIFSSWAAAVFAALLICLFLLLPRAQPGYRLFFTVDRKVVSQVLRFSFLNYLGDLFWSLPGLLLPLIVINTLGAANNAYFYIAWGMAGVVTMIPAAIATSLLAEGSYAESQLRQNVRRSLKLVSLIIIPAVILVWFLADKFLLLYGGIYAQNATSLLRWLTAAAVPVAINIVYFSIKRVQKKIRPIIILTAIVAVITVVGSYLLLPRMGINGIGMAWLAGQGLVACIAMVWDVRKWL